MHPRLQIAVLGAFLLAGTALAQEVERPVSVPLSEVEIRIVSTAVGLLDQGCEYGSHEARFSIRGTGEVRFEFEIFGGECPVEVFEFALDPEEVDELLEGLWAGYFFKLEPRYSGQPGVMIDRSGDGELIDVVSVTTHTLDVRTTVRLGEWEHSVRFDHGAQVPGLTPLMNGLLPKLWKRSGFQRHLPPEEREPPE